MIKYDRRAPDPLMEVLEGGWASSLAEYGGCGAFALDLQLRRNYDSPDRGWASLYVGLTKVLDLHYHPTKGFRLAVHDSHKEAGPWNLGWEAWFPGLLPPHAGRPNQPDHHPDPSHSPPLNLAFIC